MTQRSIGKRRGSVISRDKPRDSKGEFAFHSCSMSEEKNTKYDKETKNVDIYVIVKGSTKKVYLRNGDKNCIAFIENGSIDTEKGLWVFLKGLITYLANVNSNGYPIQLHINFLSSSRRIQLDMTISNFVYMKTCTCVMTRNLMIRRIGITNSTGTNFTSIYSMESISHNLNISGAILFVVCNMFKNTSQKDTKGNGFLLKIMNYCFYEPNMKFFVRRKTLINFVSDIEHSYLNLDLKENTCVSNRQYLYYDSWTCASLLSSSPQLILLVCVKFYFEEYKKTCSCLLSITQGYGCLLQKLEQFCSYIKQCCNEPNQELYPLEKRCTMSTVLVRTSESSLSLSNGEHCLPHIYIATKGLLQENEKTYSGWLSVLQQMSGWFSFSHGNNCLRKIQGILYAVRIKWVCHEPNHQESFPVDIALRCLSFLQRGQCLADALDLYHDTSTCNQFFSYKTNLKTTRTNGELRHGHQCVGSFLISFVEESNCLLHINGHTETPAIYLQHCCYGTDVRLFRTDKHKYKYLLNLLQENVFPFMISDYCNNLPTLWISKSYSVSILSLEFLITNIDDFTRSTLFTAFLIKASLDYEMKNSLRVLKNLDYACLDVFSIILKSDMCKEVHCDELVLDSQEIKMRPNEEITTRWHCKEDEQDSLAGVETLFHNGIKISSIDEIELDHTASSPMHDKFSFKVKGYFCTDLFELENICEKWFANERIKGITDTVSFKTEKPSTYPIHNDSYTVFPVLRNDLEYSFRKILTGTPVLSSEIMRFEHHRLATFKHYKGEDSPSFILLASAGWFATGNGTETQTFCCLILFSKWTRVLDPLLVHKDLAPTCPFMTGLDVGQVSVQQKELKEHSYHTNGDVTETRINAEANDGNENEIVNELQNIHISGNGINNSHADDTNHAVQNHIDGMQWRREPMHHELPPRQASTRTDFASSGTCSVDYNSQSIVNGQDEHRRYVRQGQNRMGLDAKTESSREQTGPSRRTWSNIQNTDVLASLNGNIHQNNSRQDNSEFETPELPPTLPNIPKHPEYSAVATRISSYSGFPSYTGQSVRVLAMAGFYFRGFGDRTVCFSCGLCIQNWRRDDDPYIEHARFSVRCYYLRQLKGDDFVKLVVFATRTPQVSSSINGARGNPIHEDYRIQESTLFDLREMGFTEESINAAILHLKSINERPSKQKIINIILENNDAFEAMATEMPPYTEDEELATNNDSSDEADPSVSESSGIELGTGASNAMAPKSVSSMSSAEIKEQFICKICMDEKVGVVFTPCGHIVTCLACSRKVRKCPICRVYISEKIKTFIIE